MVRAKQSRRDLILETSLRLFAAGDLQAVSMAEIAEAARIPVGSIYTYFKGKDALIHAVYLDARQRLQQAILGTMPDGRDPKAAFTSVWTFLCRYHIDHPDDFLFAERFHASPYFTDAIRAADESLWRDLATLFATAQKDGILKPVPLDLFLPMLNGSLSAVIRNHIQGTRPVDDSDIAVVVALSWDAIAARESSRS